MIDGVLAVIMIESGQYGETSSSAHTPETAPQAEVREK
jgi:hypothetical protein